MRFYSSLNTGNEDATISLLCLFWSGSFFHTNSYNLPDVLTSPQTPLNWFSDLFPRAFPSLILFKLYPIFLHRKGFVMASYKG